MTSIQITHCDLREQMENLVQDSYIQKCIGKAEIPEDFIELLEILFSNYPCEAAEKNRLGIASILLQMGLEMHKRVSTQKTLEPTELQLRQQLVLAGDYYSSLFYYLLAQQQDIQLIQYFSEQILMINEAKMSFHMRSIQESIYDQEMLSYLKKLSSGLLLAVADFFHVQDEFIFLWKKTGELYLLMMELVEDDEWKNLPYELRLQIVQEWQELTKTIHNQLLQAKRKQQLLAILMRLEEWIEKIASKES